MGAWLIIIRYCCGKQCELLLNRFLIKDLHHKLNLLCQLHNEGLFFYNWWQNSTRTSFSTPCRKQFQPPIYEKSRSPHLHFDNSITVGNIIRRRRLCWMGHIARMEGERRAAGHRLESVGKHIRGRPWKNWQETIHEDIRCINMKWSEAITLAGDREGWRDCVALRAEMHGKD